MIALVLIMLAGVCKAVSDTLAHHFDKSVFGKTASEPGASWDKYQFWNPAISWSLKWKNGDDRQGEAFWGSSTVFAWVTDGWHLFNMFQYLCVFLALPAYAFFMEGREWWWHLVAVGVLRLAFSVAFEVCYRWVFIK